MNVSAILITAWSFIPDALWTLCVYSDSLGWVAFYALVFYPSCEHLEGRTSLLSLNSQCLIQLSILAV